MKLFINIVLTLVLISEVTAQNNVEIFLDKNFIACDQSEAVYKRIVSRGQNEHYNIKDYYADGDTLFQKGSVTLRYGSTSFSTDSESLDKIISRGGRQTKNGVFERYFKNGNLEFSGTYVDDKKSGPFKYWYETGAFKGEFFYADDLEIDHEFQVLDFYDTLNNQLVVDGVGKYFEQDDEYQASGKVDNGYKTGTWTGYFKGGKSTFEETYTAGKLVKGKSLDSLNVEYSYTEILKTPEYATGTAGFYKYLGTKIKYPKDARRNGIEGRVFVQFVVDKEGNTIDVKVIKGISPSCDKEAKRVIEMAKKFIPGRFRGQIVKIRMVLPVRFKLT